MLLQKSCLHTYFAENSDRKAMPVLKSYHEDCPQTLAHYFPPYGRHSASACGGVTLLRAEHPNVCHLLWYACATALQLYRGRRCAVQLSSPPPASSLGVPYESSRDGSDTYWTNGRNV